MKSKHEIVNCPICNTQHHISNNDRNKIVKCLCGKKLIIVAFGGKKELMEV